MLKIILHISATLITLTSFSQGLSDSISKEHAETFAVHHHDTDIDPKITNTETSPLPEIIPYKDVLLALKIVDGETNTPLQASIITIAQSNARGQGICDTEGKFHFNINNKSVIELHITHHGYHTQIDTVDFQKEHFSGDIYTKTYKLNVFRKGEVVTLSNIYFEQGKDAVLPTSHLSLNRLADLMKLNPSMVIRLEGHTETQGSHKQLVELSLRRVNSVRFYLIQKNIKTSRIKTVGYGPNKPAYTGKDTKLQKQNRRVTFTVIKL